MMFQHKPSVSVKMFVFFMLFCSWSWSIARDSLSKSVTSGKDEERKTLHWVDDVDPGDMFSSSFNTESNKHQQEEIDPDSKKYLAGDNDPMALPLKDMSHPSNMKPNSYSQPSCDVPHFKHLTRIILECFQTPGKRYATIELTSEDLKILQEFKEKDVRGERVSDVLHLIIGIFQHIQEERQEGSFFPRTLSFVEYNNEKFALIFIISLLIAILVVFETRTTMPWYQQCWYLFWLTFIISIPWEWFRLYRKEFADKQAQIMKEIPKHCTPESMTITAWMSLWMAGLVSWSEDNCIKYQEAILVDPVWEVSPSLALSTTATRLVFKPLEYIGDSSGKSLKAFFVHIPSVWQPVMFVFLSIILLFFILLFTKSRIKLGFLEIGPGITQRQDVDMLRNCIRQELERIHGDVVPVREANLEELPRLGAAVQEERADSHFPRAVRETESSVHGLPVKENSSV